MFTPSHHQVDLATSEPEVLKFERFFDETDGRLLTIMGNGHDMQLVSTEEGRIYYLQKVCLLLYQKNVRRGCATREYLNMEE